MRFLFHSQEDANEKEVEVEEQNGVITKPHNIMVMRKLLLVV